MRQRERQKTEIDCVSSLWSQTESIFPALNAWVSEYVNNWTNERESDWERESTISGVLLPTRSCMLAAGSSRRIALWTSNASCFSFDVIPESVVAPSDLRLLMSLSEKGMKCYRHDGHTDLKICQGHWWLFSNEFELNFLLHCFGLPHTLGTVKQSLESRKSCTNFKLAFFLGDCGISAGIWSSVYVNIICQCLC